MTYCLAITVDEGLVMCSDSRTSAGVDQVSTYSKMHSFGVDGERQLVLLSAGNLATTQSVLNQLRRDMEDPEAEQSLMSVGDLPEAADYLGRISREQQTKHLDQSSQADFNPEASFILGGQIADQPHGIYMIYPQGNHITTSEHTRFLQIGESKYGKPILDRIVGKDTSLEDAARCALVSMDSTTHSNVTVGPPFELLIYKAGSLKLDKFVCLKADSPYLKKLKDAWDAKVKEAFAELPKISRKALRPRGNGCA
jgi:putative proteasome-type protease